MKTKRYIFCGDIHGEWDYLSDFIREAPDGYQKVFVGDYIDSFNASIQDQLDCLDLVLFRAEDCGSIALLGNHELSYLQYDIHGSSGWTTAMNGHIMTRSKRMYRLLKWFHYIPEYHCLVTHAGLTNQLLTQFGLSKENLILKLTDMVESRQDKSSLFSLIGMCRGGWSKYGGPMWCDRKEFVPIPHLNQVFGHSTNRSESEPDIICVGNNSFNIDSYRHRRAWLVLDEQGFGVWKGGVRTNPWSGTLAEKKET